MKKMKNEVAKRDDSDSVLSQVPTQNLTTDEIYGYYRHNLVPSIIASLPLLFGRMGRDIKGLLCSTFRRVVAFLIPWKQNGDEWSAPSLASIWNQTWPLSTNSSSNNSALVEFMLRHFDIDDDGHISAKELLNMQDFHLPTPGSMYQHPQNWFTWFQRAWPMMDWKIGVFLWRSCGGLLLVIAIASIVPGRLHRASGRLLRWPILFLTYLQITVELTVYVIIRLFIRLAETTFAHHKHRALRKGMSEAKSYAEWYKIASELDKSQKRNKWQERTDDSTSYQYNWAFIRELMADMRIARDKDDALLALAVLQQCTRKNVGGIMSEDLFSYTNTGEPKWIVKEFVEEVVTTLKWVTEVAKALPEPVAERNNGKTDASRFAKKLESKMKEEEKKLNGQIIQWASPDFQGLDDTTTISNTEEVASAAGANGNLVTVQTDPNLFDNEPPETSTADSSHSGKLSTHQLPPQFRDTLKTFLKRARAAYGRTALCLSGGAMMGNYHFGHVKALVEEDALPHIVSGTSAGGVVAAILCTRTNEELATVLKPEELAGRLTCFSKSWPDRLRNMYKKGHFFDNEDWLDLIQWFTCGDMTFEEAYRKTGRILCITLSATTKKAPPVLINYITAPNVVIASAIVASAAVPGFIKPMMLQVKGPNGVVRVQGLNKDQAYWDGSIDQDIPTAGLAEMFNCQFFLAAQCNPHIVPFFYNSKGGVGRPCRWSTSSGQNSWRGGFLLSALELYLKLDMKAKFHFLNDLDAAIGFTSTMMTQGYEGTTTIVPQVSFQDYFKLFSDPTLSDMQRYFQVGTVSAYQHCAMVKLHYRTAYALDECLDSLEECSSKRSKRKGSTRAYHSSKPPHSIGENQALPDGVIQGLGSNSSSFDRKDENGSDESTDSSMSSNDDEYESGGFDGVDVKFAAPKKQPAN